MMLLQFLLFSSLIAGILYLHFFLAHREWRRLRQEVPLDINWNYVRTEDFLGQSFRRKVGSWLEFSKDGTDADRLVLKGRAERIRVSRTLTFDAGSREDDIFVLDGDFACGPDSVFGREIYAKGDAKIGDHSQLQAIATDGNLTLGSSVTILRWIDSRGDIVVGEDAQVGAKVTSRAAVRLSGGARVRSVFAPLIFTDGVRETWRPSPKPEQELFEIPNQHSSDDPRRTGFAYEDLLRLSEDCWLYEGDLHMLVPILLKGSLVVKGDFSCPRESLLEAHLKANGSIRLGPWSAAKGNLVATGDIDLSPYTHFQGIVHSGGMLRLGEGVRGFFRDGLVAYAAGQVELDRNVVITGKVASGTGVKAIQPASRYALLEEKNWAPVFQV